MTERNKLNEATLRAYLDEALSPQAREQVDRLLAHSGEAQASLKRLRLEIARTDRILTQLAPTAAEQAPAAPALKRLQSQLAAGSPPKSDPIMERILFMFSKSFIKRHQPLVAGLALVVVLAVALSFAPVRALAGDLLSIFRVQQVKVVPVDMNRLETLEQNEEFSSLMEQFSPESETIVEAGEPVNVASLGEAAGLVDFAIAGPTDLPADAGSLAEISVLNRSVQEINLDPDLMEAIFEAAGISVDLPDSLQDTPVIVTRPALLHQSWANEGETRLEFVQLNTPQIEYPDDLNLDELGVAVLQLMGLSEAEAVALGATIDWANTLILPVPSDGEVEVSEVQVNGASGTLFKSLSEEQHPDHGEGVGLMWQAGGKTYMLTGDYSPEQLLQIAESVQ